MTQLFSAYAIPHKSHRYPTCGDWLVCANNVISVRVSKLGNAQYEMLVAIHELIEATLCAHAGIHDDDVTAFDAAYECARAAGVPALCGCMPTATSEPGDDIHAPYRVQHQRATRVERMLAAELGVSWEDYEAAIEALFDADLPQAVGSSKQEEGS